MDEGRTGGCTDDEQMTGQGPTVSERATGLMDRRGTPATCAQEIEEGGAEGRAVAGADGERACAVPERGEHGQTGQGITGQGRTRWS